MIVNLMDKFVWMLLVTVIATQALQIARAVNGPTKLGSIEYPQQDQLYEFQITSGATREKRQSDDRSSILDNIFNIPITALNSVNELLQSTQKTFRQGVRELQRYQQEQAQLQAQQQAQQQPSQEPDQESIKRRNRYNRIQPDGSSSRVPIATLNSVNDLVQNVRKTRLRNRENYVRYYQQQVEQQTKLLEQQTKLVQQQAALQNAIRRRGQRQQPNNGNIRVETTVTRRRFNPNRDVF